VKTPLILITEDDADDRFLLQTAFAEKKYPEKIEFVENGVELIKKLQHIKENSDGNFPTLILLDLNMPKKDGREALKELKLHHDFRHIPVFIFTTTHNEQEILRCNQLGASRYIVKPVTFDGLLKVIDELHDYCNGTFEKKRLA
jgi:CheY-like chemotaxis protein